MEKKRWIQYSWQTLLLCIAVSLSHPVSARPSSSLASERDHTRKPKSAKSKPVSSAAKEKSTQKAKNVTTSQAVAQRPSRPLERSNVNDAKKKKRTNTSPGRANLRYVTALKETPRKTMEKTVVAVPLARTASQKQRRNVAEIRAQQKFPDRTARKERQDLAPPQASRALRSQSVLTEKPSARAPSFALRKGTVAPEPPTVPPMAAVTPPAADAPTLPEKTEPAPGAVSAKPVAETPVQEPLRTVAATPSLPTSSQTGVTTFVQQDPTVRVVRPEKRAKESSRYTPQKSPFTVTVNDEQLRYRTNSVFVLPGDEIFLAVADSHKRAEYTIRSTLGPERLLASRRWYWTAPTTTGAYPVKIINRRTNASLTLNLFVMVPLDRVEDGYLNGYRIGTYPTEPLRQLAMYTRPRGLIEVTEENENILVSPHFRLRQFLCKQDGGYPKYMILDARLLTTLEQLLEMVNTHGYQARTFTIMSGYRTPYYNRAIGNRTTYSRHLWGDAADIFIDEEPRDGKMDDLNQDGIIDAHDADVIYQLIENVSEPRIQKITMGGLARYRETSSHGPFIHVDARGSYARWGLKTLTRGGTTPTEAAFPMRRDARTQPSFLGQPPSSEPTP